MVYIHKRYGFFINQQFGVQNKDAICTSSCWTDIDFTQHTKQWQAKCTNMELLFTFYIILSILAPNSEYNCGYHFSNQ